MDKSENFTDSIIDLETSKIVELLKNQVSELQQRLSVMNETVEIAAERLLICTEHLQALKLNSDSDRNIDDKAVSNRQETDYKTVLNRQETDSNDHKLKNKTVSNNEKLNIEAVTNCQEINCGISYNYQQTNNKTVLFNQETNNVLNRQVTIKQSDLIKTEAEYQKDIIINELKQIADQLLNCYQNKKTPKIIIEKQNMDEKHKEKTSPQRRNSFQIRHKIEKTKKSQKDEWDEGEEMQARVCAQTLSKSLKSNNELMEIKYDRRKLF